MSPVLFVVVGMMLIIGGITDQENWWCTSASRES